MNPPAPTANEINDFYLDIDTERYKLIIYPEFSQLVFKLEPENKAIEKIYQNRFMLDDIKTWHLFFQGFQNIEQAKENFIIALKNNIQNNPMRVEKNGKDIILIINLFGKEVSLLIKLIDKKFDISYDSLSEEMKKIIDNNKIILGIDLGTTYSCACAMIDEHFIIIENSLGLRSTPSYVCFLSKNEICTGNLAKLQPSQEFKNIVYNAKRLLGRNINDKEIKEIIPDLPFEVRQDDELNQLNINIDFKDGGNKRFYPEQISSFILRKLVKDSEYYLTKKIKKKIIIKNAVITVPAYFNQKQREATYQAAEIINLNVKRMINEPTAASLAYGFKSLENNKKIITVLDFGGGTLDLTLLNFIKNEKGVYCEIKFSYGNTHFGGEDFDYILMKKCLENLKQKDFNKKLQCNIRLKRACEIAKIKLSTSDSANIILEEYSKNININFTLTKNNFETLCNPIFVKFENILSKFLSSCGYKDKDIAEVILIGGSTLIPKVETIIKKVFKFSEIKKHLNPEEAVARGAAIQAAMLSKLSSIKNMGLLDVTNLSFGVCSEGYKMSKVIKRSTPLPADYSHIYATFYDNQTEALIEIFEGEDEQTKNNLCLDKLLICGLPKMKKNKAKIKVNIEVDKDSILKVTASDMQNENNVKQLEIKRPKGLRDKINQLKIETEEIKEIELEEYNHIKDLIIDLEEEYNKIKDKGKKQEIYSKLIKNLAEFIMNIIKNKKIDKDKIIVSYIKYYFQKVVKYIDNNNIEDIIIENILKNVSIILDEVQFNSSDLIFEIIEIFVDNNKLYSKCLIQLSDHYYEKIANEFYQVNLIIKNEPNNFKKALQKLEDLKKQIKLAQRFINPIPPGNILTQEIINVRTSIEELNLKIEVKEIILKNREKRIDFSKKSEKTKLENLISKYQQCKSNDVKDLIELESIIKKSNIIMSEDDKKAFNFIQIFNKMKDDDFQKLDFVFDKFNITEYSVSEIIEKINNPNERYDLLIDLCDRYSKYNDDLTPGNKKDAISRIQIYFNHLKEKCTNNNASLFTNQ